MTRRIRATPYLFLAPALILLGIFVIYPIIAVVWYSFNDYNIVAAAGLRRARQLRAPHQ